MQLATGVLERTFEHLRRCGAGRRECVVLLTGPTDEPMLADEVLHPRHAASAVGYDLDSRAIGELWRDLLARGRSVRMQVHTHPGRAYHSSRDDALAVVATPGYLSLVIPNFAAGPVSFDQAFLAERAADGTWQPVAIDARLSVVQ